jgi:hypothetical protein
VRPRRSSRRADPGRSTVRPVKIQQRTSGGTWRTLAGLVDFAVVQSYLDTATKWGIDKLHALRELFTKERKNGAFIGVEDIQAPLRSRASIRSPVGCTRKRCRSAGRAAETSCTCCSQAGSAAQEVTSLLAPGPAVSP